MRIPALLASSLLLSSALPGLAQTASQRLGSLAESMLEREMDLTPALEAYAGGSTLRANRMIVDLSPGADERRLLLYRAVLSGLETIAPEGLSPTDRATHAMLALRAQAQLDRERYPLRALAQLTPTGNALQALVRIASSTQPLRSEQDFEAWRQRVEASARIFDDAIVQLRAAAAKGWIVPRALVERTLAQFDPIATKKAYDTPFWAVLARYPAEGGDRARTAFRESYRATLDDHLLAALRRFTRYVRVEYLPRARASSGIGALPDGDKAYRILVREYTTLDRSPEELHALGLAEVARVRAQLLQVARGLGFKGEMREFAGWVASSPANYPFHTTEEVLEYLRKVHARIEPQLPRLFRRVPRARFEIRATPAAIAASSSATYSRPTADGTRPGIFHIPVVDPRKVAAFSLTSLLMHEGMPGHHLDIGRAVELDLPRFRRVHSLTVYSEGWGLYAEGLGEELGAYDDPWALLGRYAAELHRAARLVVDTGLHSRGWSREEAIRYLVEERGQAERSATVAVERYMSTPGQALAYKVGELEIRRMRDAAREVLGDRFDLRDFHEAVLGDGALPMELLGARVRAWVASRPS